LQSLSLKRASQYRYHAILCELQPVPVADIALPEDTSSDVLHKVSLPTELLSDKQLD
jgi:hypothetical protein